MSCTDCTVILLYCKVVMNLDVYNCGLYQSLFYMFCSVIVGQLICTACHVTSYVGDSLVMFNNMCCEDLC